MFNKKELTIKIKRKKIIIKKQNINQRNKRKKLDEIKDEEVRKKNYLYK